MSSPIYKSVERFSGLHVILLSLLALVNTNVHAQSALPINYTIEGRLFDQSATPMPIDDVVDIRLELIDPAAPTCVIYREEHDAVDLRSSDPLVQGRFAVKMGSGTTINFGAGNLVPAFGGRSVTGSNDGDNLADAACNRSTNPAANNLQVRVYVTLDSVGVYGAALSPNVVISSVPQALAAESLQGFTPNDFLKFNATAPNVLTQTNLESIFSTPNFTTLNALLGGTSTLYLRTPGGVVSSNINMGGNTITNVGTPAAGTDAVNKTYADTKIAGSSVYLTGISAGETLIWNGSAWEVGTPAATDATKLPLTGGTMTGPVTFSAQDIYNTGHITIGNQRTLMLGRFTNLQEGLLGLGAGDAGRLLYNTDMNTVRLWDGVGYTGFTPAGAAGGELAGTYPNPTIANNVITSAKILDGSVATGDLTNDAVTAAKIDNAGIGINRLLMSDGTDPNLVRFRTCALNQILQWTATGWTCVDVGTTLPNTGVAAGAYGSSTMVSRIGVNAQGTVTSAVDVAINFPVISVNGMTGAVDLTPAYLIGHLGLGTAAQEDVGTTTGTIPVLGVGGKLNPSVIPTLGIGDISGAITQIVANGPLTGGGSSGVVTIGLDTSNLDAAQIRGRNVSTAVPAPGQVLKLNASGAWEPMADDLGAGGVAGIQVNAPLIGGGTSPTVTISIDPNLNVTRIGGNHVATIVPSSASEVLKWNGSSWVPQEPNYNDLESAAGVYFTYMPNGVQCGVNQVLKWDGAIWDCDDDLNSGDITQVMTTGPLLGGGSSGGLTLSLDVGVTTGQIVQVAAGDRLPVIDGSNLTQISNLRGVNVSTTAPTVGQVLRHNGSAWEAFTPVDNEGVTLVAMGSGMLGGSITSTGTVTIDVGTGPNQIVQLNGSSQLPAVNGSQLTNINAVQLQSRDVASGLPADNQVLTWNNAASRWEPRAPGAGADNLGSHIAAQHIQLNGFFLSGDGGAEGVFVAAAGNVGVGTNTPDANSILDINGLGAMSAMIVPRDTAAARPTGVNGMIRYNTNTAKMEIFENGGWTDVVQSFTDTTGIVTLTGENGLVVSGPALAKTLSIDTGVNTGQIVQVAAGNRLPVIDGSNLTQISNLRGVPVSLTAPLTGQVLKANATGGWEPGTDNGTASGVAGRVQFSDGAGALSSDDFHWDSTNNRLGVNQTSPSYALHVGNSASSTQSAQFEGPVTIRNNSAGSPTNLVLANLNGTSSGTALELNGNSGGAPRLSGKISTVMDGTGWLGAMMFHTGDTGTFLERMRLDFSGRLGIGTTAPTDGSILDLNGLGTGFSSFVVPRDTTAARPTGQNGMIRYNTSLAKFEVYENDAWINMVSSGGGAPTFPLTASPTGTNAAPAYSFNGNANTGMFSSAVNTIGFTTNGTERMRIANTGVSIGTTSAPDLLTVYKNANQVSNVSLRISGNPVYNNEQINLNFHTFGTATAALGDLGATKGWDFAANGDGFVGGAGDDANDFSLTNYDGGTWNDVLRFKIDGRVGVGTNTPMSIFDISDPFGATVTLSRDATAIGNTDSIGKLQFWGRDTQTTGNKIYGDIEVQAAQAINTNAAAGNMIFRTTSSLVAGSPVERMRIQSSGNIGIGTATANAGSVLDLYGTGNLSSLLVPRGTTAERAVAAANGMIRYNTNLAAFEVYANNSWAQLATGAGSASQWTTVAGNEIHYSTANVGIGTNNPTEMLHVAGNIQADGVLRTSSTGYGLYQLGNGVTLMSFVGNNYGQIGTDSNHNLALQTNGADRVTILADGRVGINTNTPNTELEVNGALTLKTSSVPGTMFLYEHASNGTNYLRVKSADDMTGTVDFTFPNSNGSNGQVLGTNGAGVTSWTDVIVTLDGLSDAIAQGSSVYLGTGAGSSDTVFDFNTGVGVNALLAVDGGANNVALGFGAAGNIVGGNYNTAIGNYSLNNADSHENIAIGYLAGDNITSGNRNLIIGYDIEAPSATASNQMSIGNLIFGTGVGTGTGTTISSGRIGIASNAPQAALDVVGTGSASALIVPRDTTAARASIGVNGMIRYNTNTAKFEVYENGNWANMVGAAGSFLPLAGGTLTNTLNISNGSLNLGPGATQVNEARLNLIDTRNTTSGSSWGTYVNINAQPTSGATQFIGQRNEITLTPGTSDSSAAIGIDSLVQKGGPNSADQITAIKAVAQNNGTGGLNSVTGLYAAAELGGTAAIGTGYGADIRTSGSATVADAIGIRIRSNATNVTNSATGIYIDAISSGSLRFGVYQAGANDTNYFAGRVGIGTAVPTTGAILDISATGNLTSMIVPRGTTAERAVAPANGMIRYNTNSAKFEVYESEWKNMVTPSGAGTYLPLAGGAMSGAISITSGTAADPSIEFTAEPGTGVYWPGLDQFGVSVSGTEKLIVGTSDLTMNGLDIVDDTAIGSYHLQAGAPNAGNPTYSFESRTGTGIYSSADNRLDIATSGLNRVTVAPNGWVGVGVGAPVVPLEVNGGIRIGNDSGTCNASHSGTIRYSGGNLSYCDGASFVTLGLAGGISSLNGSTVGSQTFPVPGTAGTAPNWSFNTGAGTHTLNIPMASTAAVAAGLLSKADYDIFNAKQSTTLTDGSIWVGNGANLAVARAPSGAVTMSNTGAFSLTNSSISNTHITDGTIGLADLATTVTNGLWTVNASDIYRNTGRVGIGTNGPTYMLDVRELRTNTTGTHYMHSNQLSVNPGASSSAIFYATLNQATKTGNQDTGELTGAYNQATNSSSGGTLGGLVGARNEATNSALANTIFGSINVATSAGNATTSYGAINRGITSGTSPTVGTVYGSYNNVHQGSSGAGSITNAYGVYSSVSRAVASIDNGYGLYIDNVEATTPYSIYVANTNAPSYFAGNVGIGITNPSAKLGITAAETTPGAPFAGSRVELSYSPASVGTRVVTGQQVSIASSGSTVMNAGTEMNGSEVTITHGGTQTLPYSKGFVSRVYNGNTGTTTNAYGASVEVLRSLGTITNGVGIQVERVQATTDAYGVRINDVEASSGTAYGLHIADMNALTGYGVYQVGGNDRNYFAGRVGVGIPNPNFNLEVAGSANIASNLHVGGFIKQNVVTSGATSFPVGGPALPSAGGVVNLQGGATVLNCIATGVDGQELTVIKTVAGNLTINDGAACTVGSPIVLSVLGSASISSTSWAAAKFVFLTSTNSWWLTNWTP